MLPIEVRLKQSFDVHAKDVVTLLKPVSKTGRVKATAKTVYELDGTLIGLWVDTENEDKQNIGEIQYTKAKFYCRRYIYPEQITQEYRMFKGLLNDISELNLSLSFMIDGIRTLSLKGYQYGVVVFDLSLEPKGGRVWV
ncbi:MAG: hypothetical protein H7A25_22200 [Leptospiraceae bacterium]|nr:hypothetical protein [Leptospiraceae bacterium]